jgi:hypothetical protein
MKNIHIIPTDKPSKLYKQTGTLMLDTILDTSKDGISINQNTYITSDEEIKEGDYFWKPDCNMIFKAEYTPHKGCQKIILTTDSDLIADGVQAIDDEFLEWFVNNPSCESVETIYGLFNPMGRQVDPNNLGQNHSQCIWKHKIIIPKEEPKQELERGITITHVGKQETLEEAAAKYVENELQDRGTFDDKVICSIDFIAGANWQAERMYSEEEVFNLCRDFAIFVQQKRPSYKNQLEWFEQFKKK